MSDKIRRQLEARRRRARANLVELGVDPQLFTSNDPAMLRKLDAACSELREMVARMKRAEPHKSTAPTQQRVAHAPEPPRAIDTGPNSAPAYRFDWQIDAVRDRIPARLYDAAVGLRDCYHAMQQRSAVADPTGVGGSSDPSRRLPLTEKQELSAREFCWITDRIEKHFRRCLENFVLEIVPFGSDRCMTIREWGAKVSRYAGDQAQSAGVASIIDALHRLASVTDAYSTWEREQCVATDRLMRSDIGRRAAAQGWIVALWIWSHAHRRLPTTQGEVDECRASHDATVKSLRSSSPMELERWMRRRDRLTGVAYRDDEKRVRVA